MDAKMMTKRLSEVVAILWWLRDHVGEPGVLDERLLKRQIATLEAVHRFARRNRKAQEASAADRKAS